MNIEELSNALYHSYSKDLCYPKVQDNWNETNKYFGMCAITSLIINDYFNYPICKMYVDGISHYFNLNKDKIIDLTAKQFSHPINYSSYEIVNRLSILTTDTTKRYLELKNRVIKYLLSQIDKEIADCKQCQSLIEKFQSPKTVHLGKDNTIILVGEAPANNGWRKSNIVWHNINKEMLPSGKTLQKLFSIINRNLMQTTFLEAVKCYPLARNNLKQCSMNCHNILLKQIAILNPQLIITLGEFPTRSLLNIKFSKFKDVVGKIYEINGYKILPIYHPSPISPESYKGNIPIFNKLKEQLPLEDNIYDIIK